MSVNPMTRPRISSSLFGRVTRLTSTVTTKQVVHAKIAIQKFCAIADGNVCSVGDPAALAFGHRQAVDERRGRGAAEQAR